MTEQDQTLEEVLHSYLERRGGVVIERLVGILRHIYKEDAPELESEETLKAFIASKPDVFKIAVSVNDVERARLVNPRKASEGLIGATLAALEELSASSEESAVAVGDLFAKTAEARKAELGEAEALPYDLESEEEFVRSIRRVKRIRFADDKVWLTPRAPAAGRGRAPQPDGEERGAGRNAGGERPPRRERPAVEPKEARDLGLADDVNDATFIAGLVYQKLCDRGAVSIEVGLPVKHLLRMVSADFKDARPDADPTSMRSLRVFKLLLAQLPSIKRQRPRQRAAPQRSRTQRPVEPVIWIDSEDELVAAIQAGLPEDLASAEVQPDVLDDIADLDAGTPRVVEILDQESWKTSVVGPTANEAVLRAFLEEHKDQAIWGFETEHRVGLNRRPAGKLALIILSEMHHTILWDVHQGGIPDCLHAFFANDQIFKGCVRVEPKAHKLRTQFNVTTAKFVELSQIAQDLELISAEEREKISMRVMTKNVLSYAVPRPPAIRDSNWELRPLTKRQYTYAIEDGFATALLLMHMVARLHKANQGTKLNEACIPTE